MKSIRLKYCSENGCTFKFVNRLNVMEFMIREDMNSTLVEIYLKTGHRISLSSQLESYSDLTKRWLRFETSEEIFFDLAEFEVQ